MKSFFKKLDLRLLAVFLTLGTGMGFSQSLAGVPQLKQLLTGILDLAAGIYVIKIIFDIMAHSSEVSGGNHQAKVKLYVSIAMLVVILAVAIVINYIVFLAQNSGMATMQGILPGR